MSTSRSNLTDRDLELLSAYRDGELLPHERADVEQRLERDPALREALDGIQQTHALLGDLPRLRAPRNFTLDPATYGRKPAWWLGLVTPRALQFGGALGAAAAVILIVIGAFTNISPETSLSSAPQGEIAAQPTGTVDSAANMVAPTAAQSSSSPQPATATMAALPTGTPQVEAFAAAEAQDEAGAVSPQVLADPSGTGAQPELDAAAPMESSTMTEATTMSAAAAGAESIGQAEDTAQDAASALRDQEEAEPPAAPAAAEPQAAATEVPADAIAMAAPVAQATERATEVTMTEAQKQTVPSTSNGRSTRWSIIGAGAGLLILSSVIFVMGRRNSRYA